MTRLFTLLSLMTAALMVTATAFAESFPYDEDSLGSAVEAEEARIAPRRRGPAQTEEQKEVSAYERQRASVERYMDQAKSLRAAPSRNYGRRGYRYDSDTGYAPKPAAQPQGSTRSFQGVMPVPKPYSTAINDDSDSDAGLRGTRFFQDEKPPQAEEPPRKQRWRVEEPSWNAPRQQPPPERSQNYPFDASFAEAFQPKSNSGSSPNNGRQALLNVKKWMRGEQERADRLEMEGRDDDESSTPTDFTAKLGLMGGYSLFSGDTGGAEPTPGNLLIGLMGDFNLGQYIGAEVEGFYGIAPAVTEESVDNSGTTTSTLSRSNQHMGAMADIKLRYALPLGSIQIVPKIGVGFGLLSQTAKVATGASENAVATKVSGWYWMAGLEVLPSDSFSFGLDYAATLNASGSINGTDQGQSIDRTIEAGGFNRFRVGAYVRLSPKVLLGGQFLIRNLTSGTETAAQSNLTTSVKAGPLTQFMGVLMFQL